MGKLKTYGMNAMKPLPGTDPPGGLSMWVRALVFSVIAMGAHAKIVSMDMCADAWVLENYEPKDIGAITFLTGSSGLPQHRGTTEELLTLKPALVVTEYPLSQKQSKMLTDRYIPIKILPPLNRLQDLYQRFPKAKPMAFPNLGHGKTVMMVTQGLHSPGDQTFWHDVLGKMGFKNATASMGIKGWGYVSVEQILVAKPIMLIILGENVVLPKCLKHIPVKRISNADYLCPSPDGLKRIMERLA
jgi:ABC-type Fe3+-hydroxamate transport system substrate-binding protein